MDRDTIDGSDGSDDEAHEPLATPMADVTDSTYIIGDIHGEAALLRAPPI